MKGNKNIKKNKSECKPQERGEKKSGESKKSMIAKNIIEELPKR